MARPDPDLPPSQGSGQVPIRDLSSRLSRPQTIIYAAKVRYKDYEQDYRTFMKAAKNTNKVWEIVRATIGNVTLKTIVTGLLGIF